TTMRRRRCGDGRADRIPADRAQRGWPGGCAQGQRARVVRHPRRVWCQFRDFGRKSNRGREFSIFALEVRTMKKASTLAIDFLSTLRIPEGPKAGEPLKLAPFQKQFVRGALAPDVNAAVLSIGRGNANTALSA